MTDNSEAEKGLDASNDTVELPHADPRNEDQDPLNPLNWSLSAKWIVTLFVSVFGFVTLMSSTMVTPAIPDIANDLHIASLSIAQLALSAYPLGYAFGPFFWGPLSEVYGRVRVIQSAGLFFFAWNLVCGFANSQALMIAARFFAGVGGSAALSVTSGLLNDCWRPAQRGRSLAVASLAPLLGPAIGPVLGGVIAQQSTWRWIFWSTSAFDAVVQTLAFFVMHETHYPTILKWSQTQASRPPTVATPESKSVLSTLRTALTRPILLFVSEPIILLTALYAGYSFGILYLILSTFSFLWTDLYHESTLIASLNYLTYGIGCTLGAQLCGPMTDMHYRRTARKIPNRPPTPEIRLPPMALSTLLLPISLVWYGWSAQARIHWIMPNIGIALFGAAQSANTQCLNAYLIDTYKEYAASAIAGVWAVKSVAAFAFPIFGPGMYRHLGYGWGNTVCAGVSVVVGLPMLGLLWRYGEKQPATSMQRERLSILMRAVDQEQQNLDLAYGDRNRALMPSPKQEWQQSESQLRIRSEIKDQKRSLLRASTARRHPKRLTATTPFITKANSSSWRTTSGSWMLTGVTSWFGGSTAKHSGREASEQMPECGYGGHKGGTEHGQ